MLSQGDRAMALVDEYDAGQFTNSLILNLRKYMCHGDGYIKSHDAAEEDTGRNVLLSRCSRG
jgi:hypothetical protein